MGAGDVDPELVFLPAGRDLVVGVGIHIGVHADGDIDRCTRGRGNMGEQFEFGHRFHIELADPRGNGAAHLVRGLADPGKHDVLRLHTGSQCAVQFARRHHVCSGPEISQSTDDGDIGVGLHRIADARVQPGSVERTGKPRIGFGEHASGIDIDRRTRHLGNAGQRNILGVHLAIAVFEHAHLRFCQMGRASASDRCADR